MSTADSRPPCSYRLIEASAQGRRGLRGVSGSIGAIHSARSWRARAGRLGMPVLSWRADNSMKASSLRGMWVVAVTVPLTDLARLVLDEQLAAFSARGVAGGVNRLALGLEGAGNASCPRRAVPTRRYDARP